MELFATIIKFRFILCDAYTGKIKIRLNRN